MKVYCLIIFVQSSFVLSLNLKMENDSVTPDELKETTSVVLTKWTWNSLDKCRYIYPEWQHVHLFLSNIMNELTKVYVRVSEYVDEIKSRHAQASPRTGREVNVTSKNTMLRFSVVETKDLSFFDRIFRHMIDSYNNFCKEKMSLWSRPNPCDHQDRIKRIWTDLLDNSMAQLRAASLVCVKLYLRAEHQPLDRKTKEELGDYLLKELKRVRTYQMDSLCHKYELCFYELV